MCDNESQSTSTPHFFFLREDIQPSYPSYKLVNVEYDFRKAWCLDELSCSLFIIDVQSIK